MSDIEEKYFYTQDIYGSQIETPSSTNYSLTTKNFGGLFIFGGITILLALLFSETHIWERFVVKYIFRASSENTESKVQPMVDQTPPPVTDGLPENYSHDHEIQMIDIDSHCDQSNPENPIRRTSNSNRTSGDAFLEEIHHSA